MRNIIALAILAFSSGAYAQDSVDIHGFHLTPGDGDIHDPLRTWRAETHEKNSFGVNLLGEYAYRPLVRYNQVGDDKTRSIEVQDLAAMNLGLFFSPHERVGLTVTSPAFLAVESVNPSSGVGVGDFRFSAPVGILLEEGLGSELDFSLSAVPHLDIPGLFRDQYFHSDGLSGGGVVAATLGGERWQTSANVGGHFAREVEVENLSGNERLLTSLSGSYAILDDLAVRGEFTFNPTLSKNDVAWTDSPAELTASVRGHSDHTLGWTAGASTALTKGAGAATFRAFLGLDVALGAREADDCEPCEAAYGSFKVETFSGETVGDARIRDDDMNVSIPMSAFPDVVEINPGHHRLTFLVPDCPKGLITITDTEILLMEPIYFDFDKATIRFPDSTAILAALVETLTEHPELTLIEVAGHTDERGTHEYNEGLSQRRMNSVVDYLADHGIDRDRLSPVGYGERHLLDENCGADEDCHQLNRRVEFKILERAEE